MNNLTFLLLTTVTIHLSASEMQKALENQQALNARLLNDIARNAPIAEIEKDLRDGANANAKDATGVPAIRHAVRNNNRPLVELLVRHRADVNTTCALGVTPLMSALQRGHFGLAHFFVEANANLNARNSNGTTAMAIAASKGMRDAIALLASKNADLNTAGVHTVLTAAIIELAEAKASKNESRIQQAKAVLQLLIGTEPRAICSTENSLEYILPEVTKLKDIDVNVKTSTNNSPLFFAAKYNLSGTIFSLLKHGARIDEFNNLDNTYHVTALAIAANRGHEESVRVLLSHGADPLASADGGKTNALVLANWLPESRQKSIIIGMLEDAMKRKTEIVN